MFNLILSDLDLFFRICTAREGNIHDSYHMFKIQTLEALIFWRVLILKNMIYNYYNTFISLRMTSIAISLVFNSIDNEFIYLNYIIIFYHSSS